VRDRQHSAGIGLQVAFQPVDALGVQVVGGFVEQQQVGLLQEQLAQRDPATLTAGKDADRCVAGRALQGVHRLLQLGVDVPRLPVVELGLQFAHLGQERVEVRVRIGQFRRDLVEAVEQPLGLGDRLLDILQHGLVLGERRLLLEHAHGLALGQHGVAVVCPEQSGHQLEQGGLAGAVGPDDADLGPLEERQGDVVQHQLLTQLLADVVHGEHEFGHDVSSRHRCGGCTSMPVTRFAFPAGSAGVVNRVTGQEFGQGERPASGEIG